MTWMVARKYLNRDSSPSAHGTPHDVLGRPLRPCHRAGATALHRAFIAFAFEFINGFHDTANAVTTVIYTHSLPPTPAVVYSGFMNFLGVLLGGTAVAFGIVNLLPVDLLVEKESAARLVMVLSLLVAGVAWNLGTWYVGLPVSSSHTLIGSILGVGIANSLWNVPWGSPA